MDREKVIKGLEETEIMLKQAVDRGGEMSVMGAFKCYNHVSDALALLKEQKIVRCKDCKNWVGNGADIDELPHWFPCKVEIRQPDWFCADGERK